MTNKKITYNIGFNVDNTDLQKVRTELQNISQMGLKDLKLIDVNATKADLDEIKKSAQVLGDAIESSFNPRLGTINIDKFNTSLKNSGQTVSQIEANFARMGNTGKASFRNLTAEILTTQREVKQTSNFIDSMAKTLGNTIKWSIASSAVNMVTGSIQKAWSYTQKLDTSLNDIRIVTGKSADEMERFAKQSNKAAKSLGAATTNYTNAALIYYQQGLEEEDVAARANVTVKAANVTGQSASEVSEQLTAVWNGYKVVAKEAELYVDKLAAVAATTAADLEELSTGMSKVSSAANVMGVDVDQLSAQLATIVSVTRQDASVVGTALKTIYARMGDLEVSGIDEFGTSLGDVSGKMRQMGIDVLDQEGNLRDMGEVIEEVAAKWGTWTDAQQQAAAVAIAGKRQYNNLIALFENWDMYESALSTSQTSAGTLQEQQDVYMDSLEARLEQLGATGERVYDALFDNESMKDFLDILVDIVDAVGGFIEAVGGGGNLLLGLGSIAANMFSKDVAGGISRVLHNLNLMREYQRQYQAELEITTKYSGANDEAVKKMVSLKEQELKYNKLLTEEQKQQFEYYIKETNELYNQKDAFEDKVKKAQEYYQEITGDERNIGLDKKSSNQYMVSDVQVAKNLESQASAIENLSSKENPEQLFAFGYGSGLGSVEAGKTVDIERENSGILAKNAQLNLNDKNVAELESLKKNTELTAEQSKAIERLIENKKELSNRANDLVSDLDKLYEVGAITSEEYEQLAEAIKKAEKQGKGLAITETKIKNIVKNKPKEIREQAEAIKGLSDEQASLDKKMKDSENAQKSFLKNINTEALIGSVTKAIGVVGQLATSISMLKNIGNILSDESLSGPEKFAQVLTNVVSVAGMAYTAIRSLRTGFFEFTGAILSNNTALIANTLLNKAKTEQEKKDFLISQLKTLGIKNEKGELDKLSLAELKNLLCEKLLEQAKKKGTAATWLQTAANWAMQASMWQITLVVLAIVAAILILVAIINGLVKAFQAVGDNGKKAFKAASEEAKAATEEFNRVKEAYEELKKSFEDYNVAQKAIEEMTTGTEEWRQAVQDANMQVIDLMNKYPKLAQYVSNVNGQLKISAAGQEAVLTAEEERVNTANRANMAAQSNKLSAQNNMTRLGGANKALDTDAYQGWAIGGGIAAGLLLGPTAGALIGRALDTEAGNREAAYATALDLIGQDNSIMASKEAFAKAMQEAGFGRYAEALWENKEALLQNSAAIEANNAAIKIQQEEIARSYLTETEAFNNLETEDQDTLAKIVAKETGSDSKAYKDAMEKLGGDDIDKDEGAVIANKYADLMGIDAVETKYDKDTGIITYVDSGGEEIKVNAKTAQTALAQEQAAAGITDGYIEEKIKLLEELETKANNANKSFGSLVTKFAAGETADLTSGSSKQIEELQGAVDAYQNAFDSVEVEKNKFTGEQTNLEEQMATGGKAFANALGYANEEELEAAAKKMGYDSIEKYKDAIQESVDNYNKEKRKLTLGLDASVVQGLDNLKEKLTTAGKDFEDFSLQTQKIIVSSLETAFEKGGSKGLDAFNQLIAEGNFNETEIQKISDAMASIDWTSSGSVNDLQVALKEAGIEIDTTSGYWESMVAAMEASTNVVQDVVNNLDTLRSTLTSIAKISDDIHLGDIISDEDYDTLVANNAELKKYFVMTADGYKYLGGGDEEFKKAKNNVLDVDEIKENFEAAEESGDLLLANGGDFLKRDEKTGKISVRAGKQKDLTNALTSGSYDAVLNASGYSAERYKAAATELSEGKSNYIEGMSISDIKAAGSVDGLVKRLGYESVQAYADAKFGGDWNLANGTLANALTGAEGRIADAESYMKNAETATMNALNQMQSGEWDQMSRDAQTAAVSGLAKNYNELIEYKEKLNSEDYNKLATTYLAEEAEQLGVNATAWEEYANAHDIDAQDKMLSSIIKIQKMDELSYYNKLTKTLEDAQEAVSDLADEQNKLTGQKLIDNLLAQANAQQEVRGSAEALYKEQKTQIAESANILSDLFGIEVSRDGGVAEGERDRIYRLAVEALQAGEKAEYDKWKAILDEIDKHEEFRLNSAEEYENTIKESIEAEQDARIEAVNTKIEIRLDLEEAKKDWEKFKQRYIDKEGLSLFREEDAAAAFKNAKDLYDLDTESFDNAYKDLEYLLSEAGKAEFGDNENAYQEALKNAVDTATAAYDTLYEDAEAMYDAWLKAEEEIMSVYDEQISKLEQINSIMSSSADLMKLLGKSANSFYAGMTQVAIAQQQSAEAQLAAAQTQFNNYYKTANDEMKKVLEENLANASQNAIDKAAGVAEALSTQFSEALTSIVDTAFGEGGLQSFSEAWERETIMDDRYLDEVNAAYAESELIYNIQKSIDQTDNLSAQKKLNDFREKELSMLKEKDKLTQADFDRANARYELLLKQIALEEAQQTANKMKLTRDASGNYTYQYVADQDAIADAEHEVAAAENELYNLNKDQEKELIETLQSEYADAIDKISNAKTEEDRQAWYEFFFGKDGSVTLLKEDLVAIEGQGELTGTYNDSKYASMIDKLMNTNIDTEDMGTAIDNFNAGMRDLNDTMAEMFGSSGTLTTVLTNLAESSGYSKSENGYVFNSADSSSSVSAASAIYTALVGEDGQSGILVALDTKLDNLIGKLEPSDPTSDSSSTVVDLSKETTELVRGSAEATKKVGTEMEILNNRLVNGIPVVFANGNNMTDTNGILDIAANMTLFTPNIGIPLPTPINPGFGSIVK